MRSRDLRGRRVAITGAARGIGLATAHACADAGMRVVIGDLVAHAAQAAADAVGRDAVGLAVDVTDREAFAAFLTAAGPLDVLVNNAGLLWSGAYADEEQATTEAMVAVNLLGVLHGSRLALDRFRSQGHGHIVNLASTGGMLALPNVATYTATKFAVLGFSRALRQELRGTAIDITAICPGHVQTDMTRSFATLPGVRVQQPEDIAAAIVGALRTGRAEVVVPREMRIAAALPGLLPARALDAILDRAGASHLTAGD